MWGCDLPPATRVRKFPDCGGAALCRSHDQVELPPSASIPALWDGIRGLGSRSLPADHPLRGGFSYLPDSFCLLPVCRSGEPQWRRTALSTTLPRLIAASKSSTEVLPSSVPAPVALEMGSE